MSKITRRVQSHSRLLPFTEPPERLTYDAAIVRHNPRLASLLALTDPEGQR